MTEPYAVLVRPVITEKSMQGVDRRKYTFRVHPSANKIQIRRAVEAIYAVRVEKVNTLRVRGKTRRRGRSPQGAQADWKKAIVTLKPGYEIQLFEGVE